MKGSRTCHTKMPLFYKDYFELKATIKKKKKADTEIFLLSPLLSLLGRAE